MDSGVLQGLITILFMGGFVLLVIMVYRPSRKKVMDEFARIPFEQEESRKSDEGNGASAPSVNSQGK